MCRIMHCMVGGGKDLAIVIAFLEKVGLVGTS